MNTYAAPPSATSSSVPHSYATTATTAPPPAVSRMVVDLPQPVCKTAPIVSTSVYFTKEGAKIMSEEGWVPLWRLKLPLSDGKEGEKHREGKPTEQNFFLETKESLTAWWLKLVEESVDNYLSQQWGFDFAAIPYNYIDQPPASMPVIKKNLDIVHTILSALSHTPAQPTSETVEGNRRTVRAHLMNNLVSPVSTLIYQAIDGYSHGVKTFLWHQCNEELLRYDFSMSDLFFTDNTPSLEQVFNSFRSRKEREASRFTRSTLFIDDGHNPNSVKLREIQDQVAQVESLFHEIWYLREMKRLEAGFYAPDGVVNPNNRPSGTFMGGAVTNQSNNSSVSDIVPVSGLILSKVHRLENELKTIVEHWGRKKY